jgi:DNA-binding Xre family transcriptional regulator
MKYTTTQDLLVFIRQQMLGDNISLKELATRLHKTQATVSMTFQQKNITLENLNDICNALGYALHVDIVHESEDDKNIEKTG